jgi:hypothetical protein
MTHRRKPSSPSRKSRPRPARGSRREPAARSPEQVAADHHARDVALQRRMAYVNFFWMDCPNKACHREKNCVGAEPCFDARWRALSEDEKQWRRDWLDELYRSKNFEQAVAFAETRARERKRIAETYAAGTGAKGAA